MLYPCHLFGHDVPHGAAQFEHGVQAHGESEVEQVARTFIQVGDVVVDAVAPHAPQPDNPLPDAVVEQAKAKRAIRHPVKQPGIDDVGRLSLHGAVVVVAVGLKVHPAVDERQIEGGGEMRQPHKVELFPQVYLDAVVGGAVCVFVGILDNAAAGVEESQFDRVLKPFEEKRSAHHIVGSGIQLVAQVYVVDGGLFQLGVARQPAEQVEVVVGGRSEFAELLPVYADAVSRAQQRFRGDIIRDVDRRKEVVVIKIVIPFLVGGNLRVGRHDGRTVLKPHARVEVKPAERNVERRITGGYDFVGVVVVGVVRFVAHVYFVGCANVSGRHQLTGGQAFKAGGQRVIDVPYINEVPCTVRPRGVRAIHAGFKLHRLSAPLRYPADVVHGARKNMFVQGGVIPRDVALVNGIFIHAVRGVFLPFYDAPVGLVAVRVRIAGVPRQVVFRLAEKVRARQLPAVCAALLVGIFLLQLLVEGAHVAPAFAQRVAVAPKLVEDIAKFKLVRIIIIAFRDERKVEHPAHPHVVGVKVVGIFKKVFRLVARDAVHPELRILHVVHGFVGVAVMQRERHAEPAVVAGGVTPVDGHIQPLVEQGRRGFNRPVVVEPGFRDAVDFRHVATLVAHARRHVFELPHAVVEPEEIGAATFIIAEILEVRFGMNARTVGHLYAVVAGHGFGAYQHEAARIIGGIFGGGRFHNHHIVDLRAGNHVERKSARVGFRAGERHAVQPNVVVTLRQSADNNEAVADNRNAGYALHHFGRVAVLRAGDGLRGDAAHHHRRRLHARQHGDVGVAAPFGRHGNFVQPDVLRFHFHVERGFLPGLHLYIVHRERAI